jgi:hypothetical protein
MTLFAVETWANKMRKNPIVLCSHWCVCFQQTFHLENFSYYLGVTLHNESFNLSMLVVGIIVVLLVQKNI